MEHAWGRLASRNAPAAVNVLRTVTRVDAVIIQEPNVHYMVCLSSSKRGAVKEPVGRDVDIEDICLYMHIYGHAHQAEPGEGRKTVPLESTKEIS